MHARSFIWVLILVAVPLGATAKVYRCTTDDGTIEYSDQPCGEEVEIKDTTHFGGTAVSSRPDDPATPEAQPAAEAGEPQADTSGIPDDWVKRSETGGERQRMSDDFDRRILVLDKRIIELNAQILRAVEQGRSEDEVDRLVQLEQSVRQQRTELAQEKHQRLAELAAAPN